MREKGSGNKNEFDFEDIDKEVTKFLKDKEKNIKESIIGKRAMEELGDFTLDVGIKKTYLCTERENKKAYSIFTKVIELFIQVYGGTVTIYPKGDKICLELITPKREL
ncbi:MAG: hypothetical protein FJ150_09350 [Euryarchaeota archaeon]|nr:hypothetical protein [Euryarchaeota archaeon]